VAVLLFAYYPAITALYMGFFQWDGFNSPTFVGLQNFVTYLKSAQIGIEVRNLAILTAGGLVIALTAPLLAAEMLFNLRTKLAHLYRPLLVIPMVVPPIITFEIWGNIFNPQIGLLNEALRRLGLAAFTNTWLANPKIAIYCLLFIGFPWVSNLYLLIYLAGLQSVPRELIEAFALESRSFWQRLRAIDLPLIAGQIRLVVVFAIIGAIQHFVAILVLTQGGPGYSTMVPGLDMYESAFSYDEYGLGMAIGTLLFVVMLGLTLLALRRRREMSPRAA
jgi:raffinose/stachyose/melibiose transport system permease protein